jgi:hypothetical protein
MKDIPGTVVLIRYGDSNRNLGRLDMGTVTVTLVS